MSLFNDIYLNCLFSVSLVSTSCHPGDEGFEGRGVNLPVHIFQWFCFQHLILFLRPKCKKTVISPLICLPLSFHIKYLWLGGGGDCQEETNYFLTLSVL